MICDDPRSRSRSQRSESCENGDFQSLFLPGMHVIKKTIMRNCDTTRQYLNFSRQDFHIHLCSVLCDLQT